MFYYLYFVFFQWEQIDWEKWMPVEVGALLMLILLLRVMRRWQRWGPVKVSHVSQEKWTFGGYSGEMYFNRMDTNFLKPQNNLEIQKKCLNSELTKESPRILYIYPLSFNRKKNHLIPTSLAVMGFDVLCLTPSDFYRIIRLDPSPHTYFQKLVTTYSVQSVICFDHAWSSCVKFLLGKHEKIPALKYIVLRPTGSWADVKSLTQLLLHPLQFLSKIHLLKYMPKKNERKERKKKNGKMERREKEEKKEKKENKKKNRNCNPNGNCPLEAPSKDWNFDSLLFIHPKTTWLTEHGQNAMTVWIEQVEAQYGQKKIHTYQFTQGDWWFYRNETVILGLIARILCK